MTSPENLATIVALQNSIRDDDGPPEHFTGALKALWHVGKGNYEHASQLLDSDFSRDAAWIRAHLHRRKGEEEEAAGWYRKAGKSLSTDPIDQELSQIAAGILLTT